MTREANSSRSLLLRLQTERRRREADRAAADSGAWTEHCAIGWMTQAATGVPPEAVPPPPAAAAAAEATDEPVRDLAVEAEAYEAIYPDRAGLIRAHGRVPTPPGSGRRTSRWSGRLFAGRTPALLEADPLWAACVTTRDSVAACGD